MLCNYNLCLFEKLSTKTRLMKYLIAYLLLLSCATHIAAQTKKIDSLNNLIDKSTSDTQRINLKIKKVRILSSRNLDSAIAFAHNIINEAQKINYKNGEALARINMASDYCFSGEFGLAKENLDTAKIILSNTGDSLALANMYNGYGTMYAMQNKYDTSHLFYKKAIDILQLQKDKSLLSSIFQNNAIAYQQESNYPQALTYYQHALQVAEQINNEQDEAYIYLNVAITYTSLDETKRAEESYFKALDLAKKLDLKNVLAYSYANLASHYSEIKNYKNQYDFAMKAAMVGNEIGDKGIEASSLARAAIAQASQNKFQEAEKLSARSRTIADLSKQPLNIYQACSDMGTILTMQKKYNEAIPYFEKAFKSLSKSDLYDDEVKQTYFKLSESYEKTGNFNKALANYKVAAQIADSIRGKENIRKATELTMNYDFDKKQALAKAEQGKKDADAKRIKNQQYFAIAALGMLVLAVVIIAIIQYRSKQHKQQANMQLQQQNEKVVSTLSELKSTQAQLIQSEKMASLGELTAGIAHEIQNPLNFVNNFSEINTELIDELQSEKLKARSESNEILKNEILNDIKINEQKINHHGRRADAIVKGMLQHSRKNTGIKEPTDVNALCDEYLRLSYHGLRAKDKNFNADFKTDFNENIGTINIISQNIGRVLINLFNNAFYAVNKKSKHVSGFKDITGLNEYNPTVSVQTKKLNGKIEIIVTDNGSGIPQSIVDKIFQPFFTTKPTGEGTGLGLSLAYDIIV